MRYRFRRKGGDAKTRKSPRLRRRALLRVACTGPSKSLDGLFALGPVVAFTSWQPYASAVLGLAGFTVAESAYQAAPLAVSLPIIDSVEPTCAVVFSVLAFHQSLSLDPTSLALESFGALVALLGIFLLGRSPLVLCIYERQQAQKDHAEETAAAE